MRTVSLSKQGLFGTILISVMKKELTVVLHKTLHFIFKLIAQNLNLESEETSEKAFFIANLMICCITLSHVQCCIGMVWTTQQGLSFGRVGVKRLESMYYHCYLYDSLYQKQWKFTHN